jgi:heme a synthase
LVGIRASFGRTIGWGFGVAAFLLLFKSLPIWLRWRIVAVFTLGGVQGVIGWWMVKSGLKADPAVSHLRLCVHLVMAFLILTVLAKALWRFQGLQFKRLELKDGVLLSAIGLTIVYGAFVAGLKAGLMYNTFPLMEGQFIPGEWNFYVPVWLNFINNAATVQWLHRVLALLTVCYSAFLWVLYGANYRLLTIKLLIQVLLGIATLLLLVPLHLALAHQAWAMVVWFIALKTVWLTPTITTVGESANVKLH